MTMKPYFTFKDKRSYDMGIIVTKVPPITKPERSISEIKIPGRNGMLHMDEETYLNYTKDVECAFVNKGKNVSQYAEKINSWLDGCGEVIFSNEPDKCYRVLVKNQIDMNGVVNSFTKFLIQFDTFPFKYAAQPFGDEFTLLEPKSITNRGTIYSEPTITIYGNGKITLSINDMSFVFLDVQDSITINSEMMEVYKEGINCNNKYASMEFPRLDVGENNISWTGNVTKVEVEPKWRWL